MVAMRNLRATLVAVVVGIALHFALIPSFEQLAPFATAIAVGCTILFSWIVRDRSKFTRSESDE
ncbi:hypothetical protein [Leucobacter luti]|uniref:hypothetical protein n=1 Tax=Leucobacter luti TaxID=340320 RepID=UPI00102AA648|nr:hypothetical protein [Leucobacter luti]